MVAPGLTKLNIPQNRASGALKMGSGSSSSLKHVAARNLSGAQRATGSTSFGIFAQRSKVGTGSIFSAKAFNSDSIAAQRRALNSNRTVVSNNMYGGHKCSGNEQDNGMNKFMTAMMAMNMMSQLGAQTADAIKSMKGNSSSPKSTSVAGDKGSEVAKSLTPSLSEMKNADTSTTLEAAISKADKDYAAIDGKITQANSDLSTLKGQTDGLKSTMDTANQKLEQNKTDIETKSSDVNRYTASLSSLDDRISSLKNTSTNDIASRNKVEADIKNLTAKRTKIKQKLDKAQEELNQLKEQTQSLKDDATTAKENYNKNLSDIKSKEDEVNQLNQDKKDLATELPKQKARLAKLQKKEDEELAKVNGQISKLSGEAETLMKGINVNDADGFSPKEQKNKAKADKINLEVEGYKERKATLERSKAIRSLPLDNVQGSNTQFKSGYVAGAMVYVVDGKEVSQSEYEQRKQAAQEQKV